jgi:hypothetical protein
MTPAYQRWCATVPIESRDSMSYTAYVARVDHMLCYLNILYPTFIVKGELVLRSDNIPDDWGEFMRQVNEAKWSNEDIEYVINHAHITDFFLNDPDRDTIQIEVYGFLADIIADLWQKRLQDTFPDRHFDVSVTNREISPEVSAVQKPVL